ncbi:hypothetical protein A2914_02475 [Candidatus Nomurabacteria bacterium RIFCSPLOWO2_01_FULL_41_21]|uniref:Uncharacterized protein n=2 Tax=Candidatus Nomuraibacteriota TaxID=1752729 RepID=A0A1F6V3M5_9BACT|nr:MAG: hypothetical protein A2733_02490 [Candidatus Nomurabacteria bacterium RIFCSPHIGHO2_01_FULL_40_20]OGI88831.1 MAG: hypothetical protein A2914_02475 [Candidatus Nomurabacteria bacterium RIFCSPLOWO2_01_FULL_41_21]
MKKLLLCRVVLLLITVFSIYQYDKGIQCEKENDLLKKQIELMKDPDYIRTQIFHQMQPYPLTEKEIFQH